MARHQPPALGIVDIDGQEARYENAGVRAGPMAVAGPGHRRNSGAMTGRAHPRGNNRYRFLTDRVDGASVAAFRIAFGAIMLVEVLNHYPWIDFFWVDPQFHFVYFGFDWVKPWPRIGMQVHLWVVGIAAAAFMVGAVYRLASVLLFVGFAYIFLLDQAMYLNHWYAAVLLTMLMCVVPAANTFALDARHAPPGERGTVPRWSLWLLRFQVGVIYFFAGVAKLNADWLAGVPMRQWMAAQSDTPLIGFLQSYNIDLAVLGYGGVAVDLLVVPGLLWRRTRPYAFAAAVAFHILNASFFSIGIFPWMMVVATSLFCEPHWPRTVIPWWTGQPRVNPVAPVPSAKVLKPAAIACLAIYAAVQLALPLRHFVYPGDVSWTEEGHRFAWRMLLRSKPGSASFRVETPSDSSVVDPVQILTEKQAREMPRRPEMILQFAHYLAAQKRATGADSVRVRAVVRVALNYRPFALLIDSTVDLAAQRRTLMPAKWINPKPGGPPAP